MNNDSFSPITINLVYGCESVFYSPSESIYDKWYFNIAIM